MEGAYITHMKRKKIPALGFLYQGYIGWRKYEYKVKVSPLTPMITIEADLRSLFRAKIPINIYIEQINQFSLT